jgi:hypothetical protein
MEIVVIFPRQRTGRPFQAVDISSELDRLIR